MTHKVSTAELYDNQSIIVKLKRVEDKVDGAQSSIEASVTQAESAKTQAVNAAAQAQQAAGSIGNIAEQAQQAVNTANAASAAASAAVTQAEQKAQAVVDAAADRIKLDIVQELGTDIEEAKDKADLAYTTANGFSNAITSMQSAVNSTQQEMSGVRTTAQNASQQATQTQGNLDLHITQAANTYATKTELASKADSTEIAAVIDLVDGKLSKSQADAYYQPVGNYQPAGDYLTESEGDAKYELKGQGGGAGVWGQITGTLADQTDLKQALDGKQPVGEYTNKEYVDTAISTNKTQCNSYTDNKVATMSGSLMQEISGKQPAGNYALRSELPDVSEFITNADAARDYQPKGDYATRSEITAVYRYRGTVSTKSQLPSAEMAVGDVYNVASTGINYAWDGSEWDALGSEIDLSDYATKTELNAKADKSYADDINSAVINLASTVQGKADTTLLIGVSNHVDVVEDNLTALEQRVAALEPSDGTPYNSLPMFTESEADFNKLTKLPDDANYIVFVLDPSTFNGGDFGTLTVDPNAGEYAVFLLWAGENDPRGLVTVQGTVGEWSQDSGDGSWSYVDTLQGDVPMPFSISYGGNAFTFTIDVGEGGDEPASSKMKAVIDMSTGDGWSKTSSQGIEFYMKPVTLGQLGGGWSVPFSDNAIFTVSISEQTFVEGLNAGFMGCIGYEQQSNRLVFAASTNATNYKVNVIAER